MHELRALGPLYPRPYRAERLSTYYNYILIYGDGEGEGAGSADGPAPAPGPAT